MSDMKPDDDGKWGIRGSYARRWAVACIALLGLTRCTSGGSCCCCDGPAYFYETVLPDHAQVEAAALRYAESSPLVTGALGGPAASVAIDEDDFGLPNIDSRTSTDEEEVLTVPITATGPGGSVALTVYLSRAESGGWIVTGAATSEATEGDVPELHELSGGGGGWD